MSSGLFTLHFGVRTKSLRKRSGRWACAYAAESQQNSCSSLQPRHSLFEVSFGISRAPQPVRGIVRKQLSQKDSLASMGQRPLEWAKQKCRKTYELFFACLLHAVERGWLPGTLYTALSAYRCRNTDFLSYTRNRVHLTPHLLGCRLCHPSRNTVLTIRQTEQGA